MSSVSAGFLHNAVAGKLDAVKPILALPSDITKEATGETGATVNYVATAFDAVDGAVAIICLPPSGSVFAVAETRVDCTAADAQGNAATGSFMVKVQDTTKPVLTLPEDITTEGSLLGGAVVEYTATASDIVDGTIEPVCTPQSGSTFPVGTTTVNCSAVDGAGNTTEGSFTVTVTLNGLN